MDLSCRHVGLKLPNGRPLFSDLNFELPRGSHVLLRGASGTGKSSLLHLLAGLMLPSSGEVYLGSTCVSALNDSARSTLRREQLGLIFQKLNLLGHLTVGENVQIGAAKADAKTISAALASVRLGELEDTRASVLSGGEQQRVAVARVLAAQPSIILADEPTSSLDDENASFVIEALKRAAQGKTLLVVSHDDRGVRAFSDVRKIGELSR